MQYCELLTPCYILNVDQFLQNVRCMRSAFTKHWGKRVALGYSIKTNRQKEFLENALKLGMQAEAVSDDEYWLSLQMGFPVDQIILNGPQKSEACLLSALRNGSYVNLDNLDEIDMIESHVNELRNCKLQCGLRVNFDLESLYPGETTAGNEVSRFGFCVENGDFEKAVQRLNLMRIPVCGLHMHYSSKTRSLNIFRALADQACMLVRRYSLRSIEYVDIGGGFFGGRSDVAKPSMDEYAKCISDCLIKELNPESVTMILEPGACILATAVDYYTRVLQTRDVRGTTIVTVDGTDLHINPLRATREPTYEILSDSDKWIEFQIVCGSSCMETDRILRLKNQQQLKKGDLICCHFAGAYTMGFNTNFINTAPYVYLKYGDLLELIRKKNRRLLLEI